GLSHVQTRLATIDKGLTERWPIWRPATLIATEFPLFGTGLGTYIYVDPLYRETAQLTDVRVDHVHNEYLELLAEQGTAGLLCALMALGFIMGRAWKVLRSQHSGHLLVLGGVFALA